jgi:hypothetical protein
VGPFGSDTELIEIAAQYQEHHSWTEIWPPL